MDINLGLFRLRNFADLDEMDEVVLALPPEEVLARIESVVPDIPGWHVEAVDPDARTVHLIRRTKLFGFKDDIHLRLEPIEGGTRLRGRSQSRVGLTDFGQNARNLRELVRVLL